MSTAAFQDPLPFIFITIRQMVDVISGRRPFGMILLACLCSNKNLLLFVISLTIIIIKYFIKIWILLTCGCFDRFVSFKQEYLITSDFAISSNSWMPEYYKPCWLAMFTIVAIVLLNILNLTSLTRFPACVWAWNLSQNQKNLFLPL